MKFRYIIFDIKTLVIVMLMYFMCKDYGILVIYDDTNILDLIHCYFFYTSKFTC